MPVSVSEMASPTATYARNPCAPAVQGRANVAAAEQAVSRARAEWTYSSNNLHRVEPLLAKQFVTVDQVDRARTSEIAQAQSLKQSEAQLQQAQAALQATQGNLSVHLRKLEDAGYIAIEKSFLARKPLTRARLTPAGRKAFAHYLEAIGKLIEGEGA